MPGEAFGTFEGETVSRMTISGGGLSAAVMSWGAVLQDLRLTGHDAPLVLGFDSFEDYPAHSPYCGAIAGRCANRLANGRFIIDGERFQADLNDNGRHTLHGGANGFGRRNWLVEEAGEAAVTFALHDPDGENGFPGALDVRCLYQVRRPATLRIVLEATCDRPTLCNLAPHSYFNLDNGGSGDILGHRVMIHAGAYLPTDADQIPTGVVQPVENTDFDFLIPREIAREGENGKQIPYDHNFCLAAARGPLRLAAWAQGRGSGVEMEVWTSEPGLQFYAGHKVAPEVPGHGGRRYGPFSGFCMEPQVWPDAPNRPYFPQSVLRPGETYRHVSEYRFRMS